MHVIRMGVFDEHLKSMSAFTRVPTNVHRVAGTDSEMLCLEHVPYLYLLTTCFHSESSEVSASFTKIQMISQTNLVQHGYATK